MLFQFLAFSFPELMLSLGIESDVAAHKDAVSHEATSETGGLDEDNEDDDENSEDKKDQIKNCKTPSVLSGAIE